MNHLEATSTAHPDARTGAPPPLAPWLRWVGHTGYIAEGVVYVLIGAFALTAALDPLQRPDSYQGALRKLASAPFGDAMLTLLVLGLGASVAWQLILGILDPEHPGTRRTLQRRAVRVECLMNGALHCFLVGEAAWFLLGLRVSADDGRSQALWTSRAMALPLGRWVIAATGVGIAIFGVFQWYRAVSPRKVERIELSHSRLRALIYTLGAIGFLARGVLFGLIGLFLIDAARRYNAAHATGIVGALSALKGQDDGRWLLGAVAVGLTCYGLFQIIKEPYRRFGAITPMP